MVQALDGESIARSNATTGQQFRTDALRVFVVASISGGTGGGMSLDMGYAVRAILQKLGLAHTEVIGVMLHSTGRDPRHSELARVNALAWLSEFNHFQQFENPYPGDVSCGLPAHAAGVTAFDYTYLVELGENLDETEFEIATHAVAEYLRFNTLSPASAFFDACRASATADLAQDSGERPQASLRSFGVHRQATAPVELQDEFANLVSQQVLAVWRGAAANSDPSDWEADQQQFIQRLRLDAAGIAGNARSLIELELGMQPAEFLAARLQDKTASNVTSGEAALDAIDRVFDRKQTEEKLGRGDLLLGRTPAEIVAPLAEKLRAEVRRWISRRIDDPNQRILKRAAGRELG